MQDTAASVRPHAVFAPAAPAEVDHGPVAHPAVPPPLARWLSSRVDLRDPGFRVVDARDHADLTAVSGDECSGLFCRARMNDVRWINRFLQAANRALPTGGTLLLTFEPLAQRRRRIMRRRPRVLAVLYYWATFLLHRVLPKLRLTSRLYFAITRGRNRPLSRAEVLGRMTYCGFEIGETRTLGGQLYVLARRAAEPRTDGTPSYGPLFTMRRVGKDGAPIHVYKLRTMHPYSEYLQAYVYERNRLAEGGKLRNDFRVTRWGRVLRRLWVDELPMLINWIRRDLKLVGVRPLSEHFEALYPDELRERRRRVRPGLVPPFYADLPRTFEEILASEERYLRAYEQAPIRTDLRYLATAAYNIVVKRARSQ